MIEIDKNALENLFKIFKEYTANFKNYDYLELVYKQPNYFKSLYKKFSPNTTARKSPRNK